MEAELLDLKPMVARLVRVEGVEAVLLGGSRARGEHLPSSDYDLGLYYRPPLDVAALGQLASEVTTQAVEVTEPAGWGPWVDGGGWLDVDGVRVDWIYRNVDRVQQAWADAQAGRFSFHRQPGHQLGVPDFAYVGEVALGVVLADRTGEVTALQGAAAHYPSTLTSTLVEGLWEPTFELAAAHKATARGDTVYVAGVIVHALLLCAHALHGRARRWLINEKGAIASAGRLEISPPDFAARCHTVLAALGTNPAELATALNAAEHIVEDVRAACALGPTKPTGLVIRWWTALTRTINRSPDDAAHGETGGWSRYRCHEERTSMINLADCVACRLVAEQPVAISTATNPAGQLTWLCPICGRAWPRFLSGHRGAMAQSNSARINRVRTKTPRLKEATSTGRQRRGHPSITPANA